jgi:hypothetical protein
LRQPFSNDLAIAFLEFYPDYLAVEVLRGDQRGSASGEWVRNQAVWGGFDEPHHKCDWLGVNVVFLLRRAVP